MEILNIESLLMIDPLTVMDGVNRIVSVRSGVKGG